MGSSSGWRVWAMAAWTAVAASTVTATGCFKVVDVERAAEVPAAGAFPHALLGEVLAARVDDHGLVDYAGLAADRAKLDEYRGYLAVSSPESKPELFPTTADQLAYYLNAYNACAITGVIDRPGLTSVDDEKIAFFFYTRYKLGGRNLDLYRLENSVIRPTFHDPRVHFALNCQSGGCPRLPQEPFDPANLDAQLDALTHAFVTDPAKVRVEDGQVRMSQIFEWYAEDFAAAGGPVAFANQHGAGLPTDLPVAYIPYDWALIAQPGKSP